MDPGNRLCLECGMRTAELFCTCTDPETFLCEQCLPKHSKKRSRTGHPTWPISDLLSYKDPRYFDRQEAFPTIQAQARQGVTEVDRAVAEYSALVERVIKEIRTSSNRVIEQLKGIKTTLSADVESALEEVERTLAEQQPLLRSKYGGVFRALVEKPAPFQLFLFSPPTCSVSTQSLLTLEFHLRLPTELLSAPISPPLAPALNETPEIVEAIRVCAAKPPQSQALAKGLFNLGILYREAERYKEAEVQLLQSCQLLQTHFPQIIELPKCHKELADLYKLMRQWKLSEDHFLQAISGYSEHLPQSWQFASCLRAFGDLYSQTNRYNECETQYLRAKSIYITYFPLDPLFATLLSSLGDLYKEMERYSDSEANYMQAVSIYTTHSPLEHTFAYCLKHFGGLLETTGRKTEAVEKFKAALQIFEHNSNQEDAGSCRNAIQRLAK